jgi:hypothetical protein
MKKVLLIGLIVALALIVVGGTGVVFARASGVANNPLVFTRTFQNEQGDVRVFTYGSGELQVEGGNLPCLENDATNCGRTFGPGGMMRGYGYGPGGMMQGYGYGPGGMMQGYGYGLGGMMQGYGYGPGGMMRGYGYGPGGMMQGYGYGPGGMMGRRGLDVVRGEGPMHEYMLSAFAEAVDLTTQEVETRLEAGETFKEIALAQGIAEADLPDLLVQVHTTALNAAVTDGLITQAQADLMLEHMNNYMGQGFGPGFKSGFDGCPMFDGDEEPQP